MPEGFLGHRCDHAPQARRRQRVLLRLSGFLQAQGPGEEVLRLRPLAHPHGRGEGGLCRHRREGRERRAQEGLGDQDRERGRQQHGAHLAARQGRGLRRGLQEVLQGEVPRLGGSRVRHQGQRGGCRELPRPPVHPQGGAVQLLQQGLRARSGAVLIRCPDHGQVQGRPSRLLQVRQGSGRFAGSVPEHLQGDAPARQAAHHHQGQPGEEDQGGADQAPGGGQGDLRGVLRPLRASAQIRHHPGLRDEGGRPEGPRPVPLFRQGQAGDAKGVQGRHARGPAQDLLRRG